MVVSNARWSSTRIRRINKTPCPNLNSVATPPLTLDHGHYNGVIMGAIASQITSLTIVYSIVYADADHRNHQSSASLAFVQGIRRGPVNSLHKWPVTRKMFPFDDVIMDDYLHPQKDMLGLLIHT